MFAYHPERPVVRTTHTPQHFALTIVGWTFVIIIALLLITIALALLYS